MNKERDKRVAQSYLHRIVPAIEDIKSTMDYVMKYGESCLSEYDIERLVSLYRQLEDMQEEFDSIEVE